jgi:stress response protein YsnF
MALDQKNQDDNETSIPLLEEEARVHVEDRLAATVHVTTRTEQAEEWVRAEIERTDVQVKTVKIGREIDSAPGIRTEGDTTIVPVFEEILVVEKRLFLREEIHITRTTATEAVSQPVLLRKQQVSVQRIEENKETET